MSFIIKNNSKHATKVGKNCFNVLSKINQNARKTITFDNGLEFVIFFVAQKIFKDRYIFL